ncbi:MAG TPA: hypothetical protein VE010_04430 [Thermoanaerobaculia bacterium]|nr:hypothetical protein [Thermoanaerobaculia bacterium]
MATRVLIVLDGGYRFGDGAVPAGILDFTYNTLVNALTGAGMEVTKAHRGTDSTADLQNFLFDGPGVNLLAYDVIWLIGFQGRNSTSVPPVGSSTAGGLGASQLNALANFMDHGGGVFATGDHDGIGADLCGYVPRVRAMRCWYGQNDAAKPADLTWVPDNFPPVTAARADTTRPNPAGVYTEHPAPFVWFENQSDSVPQPMVPASSPAHPILRRNGADITVFPDHMHEGQTLGPVAGQTYMQNSPFGNTTKPEFREIAGHRQLPQVIATGTVAANANRSATGGFTDTAIAAMKTVNTLSVYDGRVAGVGRVVTGATFHHYVDINLTGDSEVVAGPIATRVGADAIKGHGFNDAPAVFDKIKAVFVNITNWLARPRPAIGVILERSTFSQDEVAANTQFAGAILLTVDGLKPTQFPGGGIPSLGAIVGTPAWVPTIAPAMGVPITIEPTFVSSDDPSMPDRMQRFTFTYRVRFTGDAFGFAGATSNVPLQATLSSAAVSGALTDSAVLQLVKSANPFMLDLADGNATTWLSSDVKVFHVIEGETLHGVTLPVNATRAQALTFINALAASISSANFTNLPSAQAESTLSPFATTTQMPPRRVYNFALARVRLSGQGGDANNVRVFFRMFSSQTTAALTYRLDGGSMPMEGYLRTGGANPIALPGTQNGGSQWLSFPMFAAARVTPQTSQTDPDNVKLVQASTGFRIFGALIDNNLPETYLTQTPVSGGALKSLPDLLTGEHQCLVAQIEFGGTPIPNGATPWTSDKLSQRNIALSPVANPGLDASRVAMHTFEMEATPHPTGETLPPDELLLDWPERTPDGTVLRIHIPSWDAREVVELADRFYARHEIEAIDDHTIEIPGGGTRYVPIPRSAYRQTGVVAVEFPLGIRKGQRFDVAVRQITNRSRDVRVPAPKVQQLTLNEAAEILQNQAVPALAGTTLDAAPKGAFDLGGNRTLFTDLSYFDAPSDHALLIEYPDPAVVRDAMSEAGRWREPIGAFQLGVPVSTKAEMLLHQLRLLSVMRWRTAQLPRHSRWRKTMLHYVDLLSAKVQALGGNPFEVPATPDGEIPQVSGTDTSGTQPAGGDTPEELLKKLMRSPLGCGLLAIIMLLVIVVLLLLWRL